MAKSLQENMYDNRIIVITSEKSSQTASNIIFQIMEWANMAPQDEIKLYIASVSYDYVNVLAIYDTLMSVKNPISAVAIGMVGGASLLLLASANKGRRYILNHTEVSIDQPYGIIGGGANQQTEMDILAEETTEQRKIFESLLAKHLGMEEAKVHEYAEEDTSFSAMEAFKAGIIDAILE